MNPHLKNILVKVNDKKSLDSSSGLNEPVLENDLLNLSTIRKFTESAFKISQMKEALQIYKENKASNAEKEMQQAFEDTKKEQFIGKR